MVSLPLIVVYVGMDVGIETQLFRSGKEFVNLIYKPIVRASSYDEFSNQARLKPRLRLVHNIIVGETSVSLFPFRKLSQNLAANNLFHDLTSAAINSLNARIDVKA